MESKVRYMAQPIVTSSPDILSGTPVFAGTRVPVQALIDYLGGGETIWSIIPSSSVEWRRRGRRSSVGAVSDSRICRHDGRSNIALRRTPFARR